jgi:hypothetical protein
MKDITENLKMLHGYNSKILSGLYGPDFIERSISGRLSAKETIEANSVLSDEIYGVAISSLIRNREYGKLLSMRDEIIEPILSPESDLGALDLSRIGLVLIRPELLDQSTDCKDLILNKGLDILFSKTVRVNLSQYFALYPHGIAVPETYYDFPTRTLNYINHESELIVVCNRLNFNSSDNLTVSDFLSNNLKGTQGIYKPGTLRGEIAFNAINASIDKSGNNIICPNAAVALDPIGAYRHLVDGSIPSNGVHNSVEVPLLFYAGQGVHIPRRDEIKRDLEILCSQEDIVCIVNGLIKHDKQSVDS